MTSFFTNECSKNRLASPPFSDGVVSFISPFYWYSIGSLFTMTSFSSNKSSKNRSSPPRNTSAVFLWRFYLSERYPDKQCEYLPPCYKSTCRQRYSHVHVIVVDAALADAATPFVELIATPSSCSCFVENFTYVWAGARPIRTCLSRGLCIRNWVVTEFQFTGLYCFGRNSNRCTWKRNQSHFVFNFRCSLEPPILFQNFDLSSTHSRLSHVHRLVNWI